MADNSWFKDNYIVFDGALGTMLQKRLPKTLDLPEYLNLTEPEIVRDVYRQYVAAGSDVVTTNTFGANRYKLGSSEKVEEVVEAAVGIAKDSGARFVALGTGPIGALMEPLGVLTFEAAYDYYKEMFIAGERAGADLIIIETMSDLLEVKAGILAAKENTSLPIFASMTFGENGRTLMGADPKTAVLTLCGLGADVVGINCSCGPESLLPFVREYLKYATVPVLVQANAGLPEIIDDKTVYKMSVDEYMKSISNMVEEGVSIVGGCCGTNPDFIRAIRSLVDSRKLKKLQNEPISFVTSGQTSVIIDDKPLSVGEKINPTGRRKISDAYKNNDMDVIVAEAMAQMSAGTDVLEVNAGLPDIDEAQVLTKTVRTLQETIPLPLQIDSTDALALESAVRVYNGIPLINSVNGKEVSMREVFPIAKKYGAMIVGLTIDENGIPAKAEERLKIAEKMVDTAAEFGISREKIVIDPLVLTVATNKDESFETLKALTLIKENLHVKTILGVSNIAFGIENRQAVNEAFFESAMSAGLSLGIIDMTKEFYARTLKNFDGKKNPFTPEFLEKMLTTSPIVDKNQGKAENQKLSLYDIILNSRKDLMEKATREELSKKDSADVVNESFIPALDKVGELYEAGDIFLPGLMSCAETAKIGFDTIRQMASADSKLQRKGEIILASVEGDIHDIGKNLVKMLAENYGFTVIDLGKDVKPEVIVHEALTRNAELVGLSALMTTTCKSMEKTIEALHSAGAKCKIAVGGAVVTEEYAKRIGADFYSKDAAGFVRVAEKFFKG